MEDRALTQAAACLPAPLRGALERLSPARQAVCEELRLRAGYPLSANLGGREEELGNRALHPEELAEILARAAGYSLHTHEDSLRCGFVTVTGGHRIGVGGSVAVRDGGIVSFHAVSSLNIRIARQIFGTADETLLRWLREDGRLQSALFLAPPGRGKTTLLRDLARQLSDGGVRVGLADERAELAALCRGAPQFDIGRHTDVISGCAKADAAMMLVKTLSPQAVVLDEITSEADVRAALYAAHCGAAVLASAHAWDIEDFCRRPLYRQLLEARIFSRLFCIRADRTVQPVQLTGGAP